MRERQNAGTERPGRESAAEKGQVLQRQGDDLPGNSVSAKREKGQAPARQSAFSLIFVCLAAQTMVGAFAAAAAPAQSVVWGILLSTLAALAVTRAYLRCLPRGEAPAWLTAGQGLLLVFCAGQTLARAAQFCSWCGGAQLPPWAVYTAFAVCLYTAARCGSGALARTAGVALVLLALSVLVLAAANADAAHTVNVLQSSGTPREALLQASQQLFLPPELVLADVLCRPSSPARGVRFWRRALWLRCALAAGLVLLSAAVLGPRTAQMLQPLTALARIGGISVLRRLDSLHAAVWLLLLLVRAAAFFCAAQQTAGRCGLRPKQSLAVCAAATAGAAVCAAHLPAQTVQSILLCAAAAVCILRCAGREAHAASDSSVSQ